MSCCLKLISIAISVQVYVRFAQEVWGVNSTVRLLPGSGVAGPSLAYSMIKEGPADPYRLTFVSVPDIQVVSVLNQENRMRGRR